MSLKDHSPPYLGCVNKFYKATLKVKLGLKILLYGHSYQNRGKIVWPYRL